MAEDCVQFVSMAGATSENEEEIEIYEDGSEMFCVVGIKNKQGATPKAPGTKGRYKQSYREAWESMRDFKGWLTSVPGNTSKAYCKLCQKVLHCHRLSLLKHKVTFKHQKKEEQHNLINQQAKTDNETPAKKFKGDKPASVLTVSTEKADSKASELPEANRNVTVTEATTSENCEEFYNDDEILSTESGPISTQITDLTKGQPGASIHVVLYKLIHGRWTLIHEGLTNEEGEYNQFFVNSNNFSPGRYKLHFDIDKYFAKIQETTIFPFIEIAFDVKDTSIHYHIPVQFSPFGYSIYKGS